MALATQRRIMPDWACIGELILAFTIVLIKKFLDPISNSPIANSVC